MKRLVWMAAALLIAVSGAMVRADEIEETIQMFIADDGLTAAEKIPALKALIEEHQGEPGIERLVDLLEKLAGEADDRETLDWGKDFRKKIAKRDGGGSAGEMGQGAMQASGGEEPGAKTGEGENIEARLRRELADAAAAAEAAAPDSCIPSEDEMKAADEAFAKLPPLKDIPRGGKVTIMPPYIAEEFTDKATYRAAIINLREAMRSLVGCMTKEAEEKFDEDFNKALEYPAEAVLEWCRKASPIVAEMSRVKMALFSEIASYDETLNEVDTARRLELYEAVHNKMRQAGNILAGMSALNSRLQGLRSSYTALGPMPDAAELKKADAADYAAAKKTIKDYFAFGGDVEDGTIEGEWEPYERYVEYTWCSNNRTDGSEGEWKLVKRTGGGILGASLFDQKKLVIKPVTQFGKDGLVYVYVYGEGHEASKRFTDKEADKTRGKSDSKDYWFESEGDGSFASYRGWKAGDADRFALKAAKDPDGRDVLLYCEHTTSFVEEDGKKSNIVKHRYKTTAFRRIGECPLSLPMSDENANGTKTGRTLEEKKKTAEKAYKEASDKFAKAKKQFDKLADGSPFRDAPPPYDMYYVLEGADMASREAGSAAKHNLVVVQHPGREDSRPRDARKLFEYRREMERMDPEPKGKGENVDGTIDINPIRDDENEKPVAAGKRRTGVGYYVPSTKYDSDSANSGTSYGRQQGAYCEYVWADHGNKNCLDQACDYKVYFISRRGERMDLDYAESSFLVKWLCPTTVMRVMDDEPCVIDILPTIKFKPCRLEDELKSETCAIEVTLGRERQVDASISVGGFFGEDDKDNKMGRTTETFAAGTDCVGKLSVSMGFSTPIVKDVFFSVLPKLGDEVGSEKTVRYRYRLKWMDAAKAREIANSLDAQYREEAVTAWKSDVPDALAEAKESKMSASEAERLAQAKAKEETIKFHQENIKFIDGTISHLRSQLSQARSEAERKSIQWSITCQESNKIYEQDRIRAEQTGVFKASRTPFDDMSIMQVRESCAREVAEIEEANRARKRAEQLVEKLPSASQQEKAWSIMEKISSGKPDNAAAWRKLGDSMEKIFMGNLEFKQAMAEDYAIATADRVQRLETVKTICDVTISLADGGAGIGASKGIACLYMFTEGTMEGGVWKGVEKAARQFDEIFEVGYDAYQGYMEGGVTGMLKKGEISFAMNFGIPYLLGKMKGPYDSTGCWNSFDTEKLRKWKPSPKLATKKPKASDVNTAFFETNFAKQKVQQFEEAKTAYDKIKNTVGNPEAIIEARHKMFHAAGAVNENVLAKGMLKYDKKLIAKGTSKDFAEVTDTIHELVEGRALYEMQNRGFNEQKLKSFRHGTSHDVGMDFDLGLVEEKGMKITRNGAHVSKHEYADNLQECVNDAHRLITGHDPSKSFVNVTYSGNKEAYRNLKILEASGNAQQMREMILNSSTSDIQQMMDVSRIKTIEMQATKEHPKMVGLYEAARGWNKDLTVKYLPALEEEIMVLKTAERNMMRQGKSIAKSDLVKLERLTKTHKKYKQISDTCGKIGRMEMPLYDADEAIRTVTGDKGLVGTIDELDATFQALSLQHSERAKKIKKGLGW